MVKKVHACGRISGPCAVLAKVGTLPVLICSLPPKDLAHPSPRRSEVVHASLFADPDTASSNTSQGCAPISWTWMYHSIS